MLEILRQSVGGWFAKVLIVLLIGSFAVWGVSGAIFGGLGNTVLEVGKTRVNANEYLLAYERARYSFSQQFGRLLTREEVQAFGIESNVVNQLVSGALLDESARKMGLGLSQKNLASLIGSDTAFHDASGNFSREQLNQALRQVGMREADYVKSRQSVAIRNQILEAVSTNLEIPEAYLKAFGQYRDEKRLFNYISLSSEDLTKTPVPSDPDLEKYYNANKRKYVAPEFRKLVVVKLEAEDVSNPQAISAEEIAAEYEAQKVSYTDAEKRRIEQLSLPNAESAEKFAQKLKDGASFEAIVAEAGKTLQDVALGQYTKTALPDPSVAEAAFGLELNKPSDVVKGIFGPVILRVTEIIPETVKPLSDVEKEIREHLAINKASEELFETHDRLEDERAAGDSLTDAAKKVQLKPRNIEKIDNAGKDENGNFIKDIPESSNVLRQAFQTTEGVETDPIPIGSSGFVWYEVQSVIGERQKPFDEVKDQVSQDWVSTQIGVEVEKLANTLKEKLVGGVEFNVAIVDVLGEGQTTREFAKSAEMSREDSGEDLPASAVTAGFGEKKGGIVTATGKSPNERIVLQIVDVIPAVNAITGPEEKRRFDSALGDDIVSQMVGDLQQKESVAINQQAINAAQSTIR